MSPFLNPDLKQTYRLKADVHLTSENRVSDFFENPRIPKEFRQKVQDILKNGSPKSKKTSFKSSQLKIQEVSEAHYRNIVSKSIEAIKAGEFQKVVLSRPKQVALPDNFEAVSVFQKLNTSYQTAFVYLCHLPEIGTWMGATPEILMSLDKNHQFTTVALAGTQVYEEGQKLSEVAWRQKEIEEQALVSRYIINCFKKIRLRDFQEEGPRTVVAGNLMHLKTTFKVDMKATNFAELGKVMLELLHPTSAVCGMPKKPSQDFVLANEGYQRAFYSGFIGPINLDQETHLFVNLRCMQIDTHLLTLYAGAGITEDSQPEKEWKETEMKCQTLLNVL
jgi:isochorismate synthase